MSKIREGDFTWFPYIRFTPPNAERSGVESCHTNDLLISSRVFRISVVFLKTTCYVTVTLKRLSHLSDI